MKRRLGPISIPMSPLLPEVRRFAHDNSGGVAVEYVLLTLVVAAILMAATPLVGALSDSLMQLRDYLNLSH
jgi:Flp pilus assembly pilin Flp